MRHREVNNFPTSSQVEPGSNTHGSAQETPFLNKAVAAFPNLWFPFPQLLGVLCPVSTGAVSILWSQRIFLPYTLIGEVFEKNSHLLSVLVTSGFWSYMHRLPICHGHPWGDPGLWGRMQNEERERILWMWSRIWYLEFPKEVKVQLLVRVKGKMRE